MWRIIVIFVFIHNQKRGEILTPKTLSVAPLSSYSSSLSFSYTSPIPAGNCPSTVTSNLQTSDSSTNLESGLELERANQGANFIKLQYLGVLKI